MKALKVRAKKHLGQHFLRDLTAAQRIADLLSGHNGYQNVLEVGPGTGVLTQFLLQNPAITLYAIEVDSESVAYLNVHFPELTPRLVEGDFLHMNLGGTPDRARRNLTPQPPLHLGEEEQLTDLDLPFSKMEKGLGDEVRQRSVDVLEKALADAPFAVIGNFPYNISSQIFFKILENVDRVPEVICMLQKEVAQRIASPPGNKDYGILSVLLQAWYDIEYVFSVAPGAFDPPPKVQSGVIRLRRNAAKDLGCDPARFKQVVKTAFNQRRKTLRNALKPIGVPFPEIPMLDKRAEQLSVAEFVYLTTLAFPVV